MFNKYLAQFAALSNTSLFTTLKLISYLCLRIPTAPFSPYFPIKTLFSPTVHPAHATCRTHPVHHELITCLTIGKQKKLRNSWLCIFSISPYLVPTGSKCLTQHSYSRTNSAYNNIIFINQIYCNAPGVPNHTLISAAMRFVIY